MVVKMAEEAKEKNGRCRKILVAVGEGEESLYALSWCLNNLFLPSHNSKDTLIILLHAKPPRVIYSALDGTGYLLSSDVLTSMERYRARVTETVLEKATKLCKQHGNDVNVETKVEDGDARDVICEAVEKQGVDLLVMGTRGYGLLKRTFLGSVSNHCAQKVKCPVLIVKRPKQQGRH